MKDDKAQIVVYVHGKGGSAEEAKHYIPLFPDCSVIGFDYHAQTPWDAKEEFPRFFAAQRKRCTVSRWWQTASAHFSPCHHWTRR